ncbi:MAG: hypothetical protein Edafosvirus12_34, partial [Edafosvirus sp.]
MKYYFECRINKWIFGEKKDFPIISTLENY